MAIPRINKQVQFNAPKVAQGQAVDASKEIAQVYAPVYQILKDIQSSGNTAMQFFKERQIAESKNTIDILSTQLNQELSNIQGEYQAKVGQDQLDYYNGTGKYKGQMSVPDKVSAAYKKATEGTRDVKTDYLANYFVRDLDEQQSQTLANFYASSEMTKRKVQEENNAVQIAQDSSNIQQYIANATNEALLKYQNDLRMIGEDPDNSLHTLAKRNYLERIYGKNVQKGEIDKNSIYYKAKKMMAETASKQMQNDIVQGKSIMVARYNQQMLNAANLKNIGSEMLKTLPVDNFKETNGFVDDFVSGFSDMVTHEQLSNIKHDILLEGLNLATVTSPMQFINEDGTINTKAIDEVAEGKLTQTERTKVISEFQAFLKQYQGRALTPEQKAVQDELTLKARAKVNDEFGKMGLSSTQYQNLVAYLLDDKDTTTKEQVAKMFLDSDIGQLMSSFNEIKKIFNESAEYDGMPIQINRDYKMSVLSKIQDAIQAKIVDVANNGMDKRNFLKKMFVDQRLTVLDMAISDLIDVNKRKTNDGKYDVDSHTILESINTMLSGGDGINGYRKLTHTGDDGLYLNKYVNDPELKALPNFWDNVSYNLFNAAVYNNLAFNKYYYNIQQQKQTTLSNYEKSYQQTFLKSDVDVINRYKSTMLGQINPAQLKLPGLITPQLPKAEERNLLFSVNPADYKLDEVEDANNRANTRNK